MSRAWGVGGGYGGTGHTRHMRQARWDRMAGPDGDGSALVLENFLLCVPLSSTVPAAL